MIKINDTPMAQLKVIIEEKGITPYRIDKELGNDARRSRTWSALRQRDMRSYHLQQTLNVMGLTLAILNKEEVELLNKK